jgi:ATP-dependent helicase/nuclease subunit B
MEPFVEQLKQLCREHPTRAKWVFVPAHGVGRTLGDRLVLEGTDWANLRFATPLDVALRMGAPFLVERGIDPSEEGLGPALIMRLLHGLSAEHKYFRPLAHQPELARALWSTITELRMAGVGAESIGAHAFAAKGKHAELQALVSAYEDFLAAHQRGDRATVFEEAKEHPDWCPIQPQDCWTELPDVIWPPLERRLMDAMPGERITPKALELPGATIPRRLAGARIDRQPPDASTPLAFLMEPRNPENPEPRNQQVSFFHAGGSEAEVEEVFRRILASGRSLDDVEIVCAQVASQALIWEKSLRYEWPVTLANGVPAVTTRPGRALVAFAEWIEDGFAAGRLRKLLQSGDVTLPPAKGKGEDASLSPGRAARILVKAEAAWGRETYAIRLDRMAKSDRARAEHDDIPEAEQERLRRNADEADELAAWIGALIASVPLPGSNDGPIDLQEMVACATAFVDKTTARASALDAAAAAAMVAALGELRALGDFHCPLAQALRFVTERVQSVHVGADRPRPGHLHVSNLRTAALSPRRLIFFIGLEEGRVFPGGFEDPILLDDERAKVDGSLAHSGDRIDEAVHAAIGRMAAASARQDADIVLSYSCRDLREFRPTYASWLMLQAHRVVSGNARAEYKDLRDHLGVPKSCVPEVPDRALGESRWWLHGLIESGAHGRPAVLKHYPALAAGVRAAEARASDLFTEFDGHVPDAGVPLDPARTDRVVSPTELEKAATCPFQYFLERGLNVWAIEAGERDRDVWLNPLLKGTLLHDAYAALLRRVRAEKRRVTLEADLEWMLEHGRAMLADLTREMPAQSREVHESETDGFLRDLELFVEEETRMEAGRVPVGLEVAFGRGERGAEESLASATPVTIDIGGGRAFRLAGQIDRIDRLAEAGAAGGPAFEIIDYKTGGYFAPAWEGTFAGGRRLQHALYGLAALELLRRQHKTARVAGAAYRFASARGEQERKEISAQPRAKVNEVLSDLRDVIAAGLFVHAPEDDRCKWCDYELACGARDAIARAQAKQEDPVLAPFVRLGNHV